MNGLKINGDLDATEGRREEPDSPGGADSGDPRDSLLGKRHVLTIFRRELGFVMVWT